MTTLTMATISSLSISSSGCIQAVDHLRRATLSAALSSPPVRFFIVDKDRRVAVHALLCVVIAAGIAIGAPWVSLVLGPIILGVPHLASEVRWLIARRSPRRSFIAISVVFAIALAAIAVWAWQGGPSTSLAGAEIGIAGMWMIASLCMHRRSEAATKIPRKIVASGVTIIAIATALSALFAASFVRDIAVGVHGFVSIAIWAIAFRKKKRFALPAVIATFVGIACVAAFRGQIVAQAFLQSVHYAVWIALIPQDGSRGSGMPTFAMSLRGWRKDLGRVGIATAAVAAASVIVIASVVGPAITRDAYLVVARFHVWLELAMAASLLSSAAASVSSSSSSSSSPSSVFSNEARSCP